MIGLRCLWSLIEREVLCQEAQRLGLTVSEDELQKGWEAELELLRKRFTRDNGATVSEQELLDKAGATRQEAREDLRKALLVAKLEAHLLEKHNVTVTDEEVREFFEANKKIARRPDQCHIKQMFFRGDQGSAQREAAGKKAETAMKRIRAGETFEGVTRDMSEGLFKEEGGDFGLRPVAALPPFLAEPAYELEAGQVSGVIESDLGFHIIKLVEIAPGAEIPLEKVAPGIRKSLLAEKSARLAKELFREAAEKEGAVQVFLELEKTLAAYPELNLFEQEAAKE
ncbi:MAG TPA: hypothetical protein HPP83_08470 [Candidatus Hydrogenedentes bacterium]|nr:hypothetical protein [Candidatus Hydrogenedentota bacterium]